ncbi:hypothetical protein EV174_005921 [Coemansia sp. RSA 2320]|nr:hypothetical protein EV174_005921 [Coemansia sp. RSA 2320]
MFLAAYALSVCIIGKRGSALLSGPNVTAQRMEAEIQRMRQGRAVPVYTQSLAGLEVVEIERCRRVLVRRGQREAGRRRQVAADFREDRMAHQAVHGLPAEAPIVASNWAAAKVAEGRVRLLLRASNGRWKMAEFSADAPLAEVRAYAEKTLLLSPGRVELALALSRHVLPPSGDARSLAGLGLAPSATLLVSVRRAQLASLLLPVWCLWIAALFVLLAVIAAWLGYRLGGVFAGLW